MHSLHNKEKFKLWLVRQIRIQSIWEMCDEDLLYAIDWWAESIDDIDGPSVADQMQIDVMEIWFPQKLNDEAAHPGDEVVIGAESQGSSHHETCDGAVFMERSQELLHGSNVERWVWRVDPEELDGADGAIGRCQKIAPPTQLDLIGLD